MGNKATLKSAGGIIGGIRKVHISVTHYSKGLWLTIRTQVESQVNKGLAGLTICGAFGFLITNFPLLVTLLSPTAASPS